MKSIFLALTLLVSGSVFADYGTIGKSTSLNYAKAVQDVEKKFIKVKAAAAIAQGQVVSLDLTADDGGTVVLGPTSGLAPICIATKAIASGALGECQTYGLFDYGAFDSTNSAAVAGDMMFMSTNNAGYISARSAKLASEKPLGFFYDAASASGSVQVFINL
jgi:hypothetical protein